MQFYGIVDPDHIHAYALAVCDTIGHGSNRKAIPLLLGTVAQETGFGTAKDRGPHSAGVGLCQIDPIAFYDVRSRTRPQTRRAILNQFGVEMDAVERRDLAFSPLLSLIWCRAFYKLIPEVIPDTVLGLGLYWKQYYNTELGKGTATEFVDNFNRYIGGPV